MGVTNRDNHLTYPLWQQIRDHQQAFSGVFAWAGYHFRLGRGAGQADGQGLLVSGELFPVLGITPLRGRLFGRYDDRSDCGISPAIISYGFWQARFGGTDSAVGSKLVVNGQPLEIVGITPPEFTGLEAGSSFDFALPVCSLPALFPGDESLARRDLWWLNVMGRLKAGWTVSRASAYLAALSPVLLGATVPSGYSAYTLDQYQKFRLAANPAANGVNGLSRDAERSLWLLLGITGLVLLIACTNIANLMLARGSSREREIAVRLAMGARRARIVRQLVSEGLVIAAGGALFGLCTARALSGALIWFISQGGGGPLYLDLSPDWRVLAFTGAAAIFTCAVCALAPAVRVSGTTPAERLTAGARGATGTRERFSFQRGLIAAQIAISLVLLVGALLFAQTFRNLVTLNPGFREHGILVFLASLRDLRLPQDRMKGIERELLDTVRAIPGVESAAMTTHTPLNGSSWTLGTLVNGKKGDSKFTWISTQYFATMGVALLAGRDFNLTDDERSHPVLIVNETFARQNLPGVNPIGQLVRTIAEPNYPATEYEIVGLAKDTKYATLRDEIPPQAFAPLPQFPAPTVWTICFIRSNTALAPLASAVKKRAGALYPDMSIDAHPFEADVVEGLATERFMAALSGFFGALAALLAAIGLYGVISYIVVRRRNEIGIRMALGARRPEVVRMVMREAAMLLGLGLISGLVLSLLATSAAGSLLFGLQPHDPVTFVSACALLAVITALASFWPARRASLLDPIDALRFE